MDDALIIFIILGSVSFAL